MSEFKRGACVGLRYILLLVGTVAAYLGFRAVGEGLIAPAAPPDAAAVHAAAAHSGTLWHVLLALAVVVLVARGVGLVAERWLKQPPVMGEIAAGILLGPSALGLVWPQAQAFLLPDDVAPLLGILAKVGVVLFMFLVGVDLDTSGIRKAPHTTLTISHASIALPFVLGSGLAVLLYPLYSHDGVSFTSFSLFMGVSMSVTAFPVLARILTDRRVHRTPLGALALACAAVDDVTAWSLLAFVASVASSQAAGALWTLGFVILYLAVMFGPVRYAVSWFAAREELRTGPVSHTALAAAFTGLLLSAAATESIGIHALFGAFLLGTFIPPDSRLAHQFRERMEDLVVVLFLPAFFALTGMRTRIDLVGSFVDVLATLAILAVATAGKFGGTYVAARFSGMAWRESAALGVLMNTRGLMELIVLGVGLEMGILSPTLYTMLVIMALVTTFATTPILDGLLGRRKVFGVGEGEAAAGA